MIDTWPARFACRVQFALLAAARALLLILAVLLLSRRWLGVVVAFFAFVLCIALSFAIGALQTCPACGSRQFGYDLEPIRDSSGQASTPALRFFVPDPLRLGRVRCVSCKEVFSLSWPVAA